MYKMPARKIKSNVFITVFIVTKQIFFNTLNIPNERACGDGGEEILSVKYSLEVKMVMYIVHLTSVQYRERT